MKDKKIAKYLIWTFIVAWILQIAVYFVAPQQQSLIYIILMALVMYAPFIGVLLSGIPLKGMGWKPKLKGKVKYFLLAWFGAAIFGTIGAVIYYAVFPDHLDLTGQYLLQMAGPNAESMIPEGSTVMSIIAVTALGAITYAPFVNALLALGEEVGWRGALYPRLKERFGNRNGRILGGIIWGVWHWPLMFLIGYEYGTEYFGAPILGPIIFCIFTVSAGIFLDYLYEKTQCIWIPALGHGAINAFAVPIYFMNPSYSEHIIFGPFLISAISGLPFFLFSIWLLLKREK